MVNVKVLRLRLPRRLWNNASVKNHCFMIKKGRSIITLSQRFINQCVTVMLMRPSIGLRECSKRARTRFMWPAGSCVLPVRISAWLTAGHWKLRLLLIRLVIFWGCRNVMCIWRMRLRIWHWLQNQMLYMSPMGKLLMMLQKCWLNRYRCRYAMHQPSWWRI